MEHWGCLLTLALLLVGSLSFSLAAPQATPVQVPVDMSGPTVNWDGRNFVFKCQPKPPQSFPSSSNVTHEWLMGSAVVQTNHLDSVNRSSFTSKNLWKGHLGESLSCRVTVIDTQGHRYSGTSQAYKGEIKIEHNKVTVVEGQTVQINVTSTLPITCDCPGTNPLTHKCTLPIEFQPPTNAPLSVVDQCEVNLRGADWDARHSKAEAGILVTTTRDLAHKAEHDYTVHFVVRAADQCQDSIWNGARLSPVQIHTKDEDVKVCSHSGDPHVSTFDNKRYSFYPPGTYRMHKSQVGKDDFEVQNILYPKTGVSICATAVQLGSYTVMLYMCDGSTDGHIPVLLANKRRVPNNLLIERKDNEYQITASTGQVVKIRQSKRRLDVTVMALTSQVEPANTTTCSSYLPKANRKDAMPEVERLMVRGRDNIFNKMTSNRHYFPVDVITSRSADEAEDDAGVDPSKYCLCDQGKAIKCEYFVNYWDPSRKDAGWQIVQPHFTELNENTTNNKWDGDLNKWNGVHHSWPTWSGITEAKAAATCDSAIRNYTLADCLSIMQDVLHDYLEACKEDILIMDDLDQTDSTVADFENACVARALKNINNYVTDATTGKLTGPKPQFGKERCPNHCSQRGTCQKGLCQCRGTYRGADCSLDHGGSPQITSILGGPVCDRHKAACLPVVLGVDNVEENDDAYFCQVSRMKKAPKGTHTLDPSAHPRLFPVRFLSRNAVLCNISLHDGDEDSSSSSGFQIVLKRLEIDGLTDTRSSNAVQYLIYDGTCRFCDETFTCYLRDETCHIDGHCFDNGAGRDKLHQYACHAEKNPIHWTQ